MMSVTCAFGFHEWSYFPGLAMVNGEIVNLPKTKRYCSKCQKSQILEPPSVVGGYSDRWIEDVLKLDE